MNYFLLGNIYRKGTEAAYRNGFQIVIMEWRYNSFCIISYPYFAQRMLQMRIITVIEGVRQRFGIVNEQAFTWIGVLLQFINADVWLSGLEIIVLSVLEILIELTLIVTESIVVVISLIRGVRL